MATILTKIVGKGFYFLNFKTMLGNYTFLSFRDINKRIKSFVDSHNALHTDDKGKKELKYQIRNARYSAMRNLINAYSKFVGTYRKNPDWESTQALPFMPINRPTISKMVGCCPKSAYNHVDFLIDAGILIKRFHGRQNDFSVLINPYFWLEEFASEVKIVDLKFQNPSTTSAPRFIQNLPPISSYDSYEIGNNTNKDVETVEKPTYHHSNTTPPQFQQDGSSNFFSRKGSEQRGNEENQPLNATFTRKEAGGGGSVDLSTNMSTLVTKVLKNIEDKGNGTEKTVGGENREVMPLEISPKISQNEQYAWDLVATFTKFAVQTLYPNAFYSPKAIAEIKNLIMRDVFDNFKGSTTDLIQIRNRYIEAKAALDLAIAHAKKHKWTGFLPPKCYFSRDFYKNGNRGTFFECLEWRKKDIFQYTEQLKLAEIEKCKRLVALEKSPKGRKDLQTRLQISAYCRTKIAKKCGAYYLAIFDAWLSNPSNFL